ncbi:phytoene desaturase family protein [Phytomonospora endophytica]|uniref:Phytoene dehydrogenase-like protein n=1 Tax=Phytomonospora endophytica TaxID=714109 RepID=A0A841FUX5_9ACTN|nr:NAD(P)/FAD-dependent oxidoreductase [Phytomonospora endophytica]MBB6037518.1 phytoene dehydrogenase-like protein [Phytomonospora endophytica]GIG70770.1 oxidoreductase [Phytomonospora endophytica]
MTSTPLSSPRFDAIIVGGGHNGLVAAAYLARAGRSVAVLERRAATGGAAVSARVFAGVDARLSKYSYLVSLFPDAIAADLGIDLRLHRRRISSYTPVPGGDLGLLVDTGDPAATAANMARVTGDPDAFKGWEAFYDKASTLARTVFPTLTEPLRGRAGLREIVDDDAAWDAVFERPLSEAIEAHIADDLVRGVVLTDGLIGTFAEADSPGLDQNRCFLYHVIGRGTGAWDVPVGGMGAVTGQLADRAREFGAEILDGAEVTAIETDGSHALVRFVSGGAEYTVDAGKVLVNAAPAELARLLGTPPSTSDGAGAQLKVNMLLRRLPRLRDSAVRPEDAFAGTFHVNETYAQLATAYREAADGRIPALPPCEIYCHSLSDPSILGPELRESGAHTLTLFGLHMPHRIFAAGGESAKEAALAATLRSLNSVLAEPIEDCLHEAPDGTACVEAHSTVDLERELRLPGGNIFHRPLSWPFAENDEELGRWGVETAHPNVFLCGAGARRGGGVSGVPGHNAAMAVLDAG